MESADVDEKEDHSEPLDTSEEADKQVKTQKDEVEVEVGKPPATIDEADDRVEDKNSTAGSPVASPVGAVGSDANADDVSGEGANEKSVNDSGSPPTLEEVAAEHRDGKGCESALEGISPVSGDGGQSNDDSTVAESECRFGKRRTLSASTSATSFITGSGETRRSTPSVGFRDIIPADDEGGICRHFRIHSSRSSTSSSTSKFVWPVKGLPETIEELPNPANDPRVGSMRTARLHEIHYMLSQQAAKMRVAESRDDAAPSPFLTQVQAEHEYWYEERERLEQWVAELRQQASIKVQCADACSPNSKSARPNGRRKVGRLAQK
eukprot:TRINITY_DN11934_c0_g1_i1.p1 TRINITY_DN11934_c0_g1~~TRINITY_DN11934_c0_g1_i1.p1  ORF type:complete len:323 (+),score=42.31 TRINITY_DN11934_c0_g1_i1:45-1013(+)